MSWIEKTISVHGDKPTRTDVLVQKQTGLSRSTIRGFFDHGCVTIDGAICEDPGYKVSPGHLIAICFDDSRGYRAKPKAYQSRIFSLVYEDEHLIVVNKAAGFLTVPTDAREKNTLVGALRRYVNGGQTHGRPLAIVHRLDRETSGLLVFAKTEAIATKLKAQFASHKPERVYTAIVAGRLKNGEGTFRSYLETDKNLNQRSTRDKSEGKLAVTHYRVQTVFADATLIEVRLETGRRNQIRVHFAEHGHPVLGDQRYEVAKATHRRWSYRRLALHATSLSFQHPVTNKKHQFKLELPSEFTRFQSSILTM